MAALASVSDLAARKVDTSDTTLVADLLNSASAAVRDAAGVPITVTTATITLPTPTGRRLDLPPPVRSVASVQLDGEVITDWKLRGSSLWRDRWQCRGDIPGEVEVTFTFGLDETPDDIVDLVCAMVGAGVALAAEGYESKVGKAYESIDDYRVGFTQGEGGQIVTVMELPERTQRWLARRFGGSAGQVETRG